MLTAYQTVATLVLQLCFVCFAFCILFLNYNISLRSLNYIKPLYQSSLCTLDGVVLNITGKCTYSK